jgi:hypothetical protein
MPYEPKRVKLREPFTFFVDRALGAKVVVGALRANGLSVEAHDAHFAQDTPDTAWLPDIARRGWVLLTKDKAIRTNALEFEAVVNNRVAAFMLGRADLPGAEMAQVFLKSMRSVERALRRFEPPIIASVSKSSTVTVLWADGAWLDKPKPMK